METLSEFLKEQINENLKQIIVSGRRRGEGPSKLRIRPVSLKGNICYQAAWDVGNKAFHRNFQRDDLIPYLEEAMGEFGQLQTQGRFTDGTVLVSKKGKITIRRKQHEEAGPVRILSQ